MSFNHKAIYLADPPLETAKSMSLLIEINSDSDLTVNSPYSSCLQTPTITMTKYPDTSENRPPERLFIFTKKFKQDLKYWKKHSQVKYQLIQELVKEIKEKPFKGKGNPKPLTHLYYKGHKISARHIDEEHRMLYVVTADTIEFLQARYHYEKK